MQDKGMLMDALKKRRGKDLGVTIILGSPEIEMEDKKEEMSDLAPEMKEEAMEEEVVADQMPEEEDLAGLAEMSQYDKEEMMQRKPRSLGERAKKMAMMEKRG